MAQPADLYKVLGVAQDADADAVKKAFRDLAKKHHPDANPGNKKSEEKFKEASQAYEILSDPEKRRRYDAMRHSPIQDQGGYDNGESINDLFEMFFGGASGGGRRRQSRGRDLESEVWVDLEEAALGKAVSVNLEGGQALRLNLPSGAEDGLRLRLGGQGGHGAGGQGDLYLTLRIRPSIRFKREGSDIVGAVHLNLGQALLGATVTVPTLRGSVKVKIPPASPTATRLRIPGQGIEVDGRTGDHLVELDLDLPQDLDADDKEKIQALATKHGWEL